MDLPYLIQMMINKLATLNTNKALAFNAGDLDMVNKLDDEIANTQNTLNQLQLALSITAAANSVNITSAELIANGLQASQNINAVPSDPIGCLSVYDISSYATDPLHEEKIKDILSVMGGMDSATTITTYINNEAIGSPLTGDMVFSAASTYQVDIRLMMALMELDSRFGTVGIAISTMNPGNVGNTGTSTATYASWQDGVNAVADWLNRHRFADAILVPPTDTTSPTDQPDKVPAPVPVVAPEATVVTPPEVVPPIEPTPTPPITDEALVPPVSSPGGIDATTTATTTTPNISSATTTPDISATTTDSIGTSTSFTLPAEATSTLDISATSTQASRNSRKKTA